MNIIGDYIFSNLIEKKRERKEAIESLMQIGQIDSDDRDSAVREIGVITEKSELLKKKKLAEH